MKVFCTDAHLHFGGGYPLYKDTISIEDLYIRPDNALSNGGKFLHLPHWLPSVKILLVAIMRIEKVAKSIQPCYAERYFGQYGVGVSIISEELGRLIKTGTHSLPLPMMYNFDSSLFQVSFDKEFTALQAGLIDREQQVYQQIDIPVQPLYKEFVAHAISEISHYYLMKIGDLVTFPLWSGYIPFPKGHDFILSKGDNEILYFGIR